MSRPSLAARGRQDANQREIVEALRKLGCQVQNLSTVGGGCPDLLVCWRARDRAGSYVRVALFEVKTLKGTRNQAQVEFQQQWPGEIYDVRTVDEALAIVTGMGIMSPLPGGASR